MVELLIAFGVWGIGWWTTALVKRAVRTTKIRARLRTSGCGRCF